MNLSDKQREEALKIIQLGSVLGGTKEMDNYLMQQFMGVLMPETDKMDELASLYDLTGDESVKKDLLNQYYTDQGIDPAKKAEQEALLAQFGQEFPTDSNNAGQNTSYQAFMGQNPEALSQYYSETPENKFNWGYIPAGIGAGALGASVVPGIGTAVGGVAGGIAGLIAALTTGAESKKKKAARVQSLQSQYQTNLPRN